MKKVTFSFPKLFLNTVLAVLAGGTILRSESEHVIKLPEPRYESDVVLEQALLMRRSIRIFGNAPLTVQEVSQLLWSAQGITSEMGYRTAPSGGALYPLEVYVVAGNVNGLDDGIYHYRPHEHSLVIISKGDRRSELSDAALNQSCIKEGSIIIVFSALYDRITQKYGERGIRYAHIEVGHAAQNVYLQAVSLKLGTVAVGAFIDDEVKRVITMEKNQQPLLLMPVGRIKNR